MFLPLNLDRARNTALANMKKVPNRVSGTLQALAYSDSTMVWETFGDEMGQGVVAGALVDAGNELSALGLSV